MVDQASQDTETPDRSNGASATADANPEPAEETAANRAESVAERAGAAPPTDDLLGEFARAMHLAATSQYERLNSDLEQRRAEGVETIAARAAAEVEHLKAASAADISSIDAWAKAEAEKIKLERLRRIDARREQLAGQLARQETIKEREVFAIEVAIDAHRNEVDAFFGRMERETDPAAIARIAAMMPAFPALADIAEGAGRNVAAEFTSIEEAVVGGAPAAEREPEPEPTAETAGEAPPSAGAVAATAAPEVDTKAMSKPERAAASLENDPTPAISESRLKAVMDPTASSGDAEGPRPWEAPYAVSVAAGSGTAEPPVTPEPTSRVGSTLLRTVRAIRPMIGERHDRGDEDH